ncbi:NUDIX domain-containing protein [Nonomuraea sp. SYSU D8015]|uniref:NUDIX domain-containing protein n=1 Tax=Nonomuraea sp. SYSU D8015 TaxID=2593644 RepID=UPI001CB6E4A8|nr:NUDIX domain-containing protein [Nonomuraea sp. SYSU D8015]
MREFATPRASPGGHLEPTNATLIGASVRELVEETGVDPGKVFPASQAPVYVEYGRVPALPQKDEPDHYHLDIGYPFLTDADMGRIQEAEVTGAPGTRSPRPSALSGTALRERSAPRPGSVDRTRRTLPVGSGTGSRCARPVA